MALAMTRAKHTSSCWLAHARPRVWFRGRCRVQTKYSFPETGCLPQQHRTHITWWIREQKTVGVHACECSVAFCLLHTASLAFLEHLNPEIQGTEWTQRFWSSPWISSQKRDCFLFYFPTGTLTLFICSSHSIIYLQRRWKQMCCCETMTTLSHYREERW